jgi:hypothetical protein
MLVNDIFHRMIFLLFSLLPVLITYQIDGAGFTGDEEIVLYFHFPAAGQNYINAVYSKGNIFLPVTEIFGLLCIHCERGEKPGLLRGTWLKHDNHWKIDINSLKASLCRREISFSKDDFREGKLEIYLSPVLFRQLFGLKFKIYMSTLRVTLESSHTLPVEDRELRKKRHLALEKYLKKDRYYPLKYKRERKIFGIGMIDYDMGFSASNNSIFVNYNIAGGMEFLGGDLRGNISGHLNRDYELCRNGHLNWKYVFEKNPFITSLQAGHMYTSGVSGRCIAGISVSNEPVIPRRVYNKYVIEGNTVPSSEVELYLNNRLSYFTKAGKGGHYRFDFPLTYGTVRLCLKIYKPSGEILIKNKRIYIPFSLLPPGTLFYNLQGGIVTDKYYRTDLDNYMFHLEAGKGISKNFTVKFGTEYFSNDSQPLFYSVLSGWLFDQYLFDFNAAPGAYYRFAARATYVSGSSINLALTHFDGLNRHNPVRAEKQLYAGYYFPFDLPGICSGIRMACDHMSFDQGSNTGYRAGYSARVKRINFRFDYHGRLNRRHGTSGYNNSFFTVATTCNFSRKKQLPVFIQGLFMRIDGEYDLAGGYTRSAGLRFSRTVWRKGRLSVNMDYDFHSNTLYLQGILTIDLPSFRSVSRYLNHKRNYLMCQDISGSLFFDNERRKIIASNRRQVGLAAVSVVMFEDSNENGRYDEGEIIVPSKAIRLDQAASMEISPEGILYISRLVGYRTYYAEVVKDLLPDPLLAPVTNKFSFTAVPNRYKSIEIPLYHTGGIEGKVTLCEKQSNRNIGGLRLIIKGINNEYEKIIKTFSDGTFYCTGILPGEYSLKIDPLQLEFLSSVCDPQQIKFKVSKTTKGDFLDKLNFKLMINNDKIK